MRTPLSCRAEEIAKLEAYRQFQLRELEGERARTEAELARLREELAREMEGEHQAIVAEHEEGLEKMIEALGEEAMVKEQEARERHAQRLQELGPEARAMADKAEEAERVAQEAQKRAADAEAARAAVEARASELREQGASGSAWGSACDERRGCRARPGPLPVVGTAEQLLPVLRHVDSPASEKLSSMPIARLLSVPCAVVAEASLTRECADLEARMRDLSRTAEERRKALEDQSDRDLQVGGMSGSSRLSAAAVWPCGGRNPPTPLVPRAASGGSNDTISYQFLAAFRGRAAGQGAPRQGTGSGGARQGTAGGASRGRGEAPARKAGRGGGSRHGEGL